MDKTVSVNPPRVLIVDGHRKAEFYAGLIAALEASLGAVCQPVAPPSLHSPSLGGDLVLINDETWPQTASAIPELRRRGIPTLHLIDGIIEWRNTWENPLRLSEAPGIRLFQPVLADKIACLGRAQARLLESWGNNGKCEVTGSPRFDTIACSSRPPENCSLPRRVLVATARRPGFTDHQTSRVVEALRDLAGWFSRHRDLAQPVWRLAPEIQSRMHFPEEPWTIPLAAQLQAIDAVITTPSTVQLEAMIAGLPVCLLDYTNRPSYVPTAWAINASPHMDETLSLMLQPSPERMQFQELILRDNVECATPATPRVLALAAAMVKIGRECRSQSRTLVFPERIIETPSPERSLECTIPVESTRHQDAQHANQAELEALRAEVTHLRLALRRSPVHALYRILCEMELRVRNALRKSVP